MKAEQVTKGAIQKHFQTTEGWCQESKKPPKTGTCNSHKNKSFSRGAGSGRVNNENVVLLLNSAGILVTAGTSKAEVLNAFSA